MGFLWSALVQKDPCLNVPTRRLTRGFHAVQAEQSKTVLIRMVDTNVVLILWGRFTIWNPSPRPSPMGRYFRLFSLNTICVGLTDARSKSLSVFHAHSGSDATSSFYGKAKVTAWQAWDLYPGITPTLQFLAENPFDQLTLNSEHFK